MAHPAGDFEPTVDDVFAVRRLLVEFVPAEITNIILDEAQYWARLDFSFHSDEEVSHPKIITTLPVCY